jgi:hypothetical protein
MQASEWDGVAKTYFKDFSKQSKKLFVWWISQTLRKKSIVWKWQHNSFFFFFISMWTLDFKKSWTNWICKYFNFILRNVFELNYWVFHEKPRYWVKLRTHHENLPSGKLRTNWLIKRRAQLFKKIVLLIKIGKIKACLTGKSRKYGAGYVGRQFVGWQT